MPKIRNKTFLSKYNNGLLNDTILHLTEDDDPVMAALAEYRRCSGEVHLLSTLDAKTVVKSVEPIEV